MANMNRDSKETTSEKLQEAMDLLVEASKEKKVELQEFMKKVYANVYANVKDVEERAVKKAKVVATNVDESVHNNPWPYIGGAALGGFIIGLLLRFRRKPGA